MPFWQRDRSPDPTTPGRCSPDTRIDRSSGLTAFNLLDESWASSDGTAVVPGCSHIIHHGHAIHRSDRSTDSESRDCTVPSRSLDEASLDLGEAIRLAPEDPAAYINRFAVLMTQGNTEAALQDLNRAVELQPKSNRLLLIRSRALRQAGRLLEAKQDFDSAMQVQPKDHDDLPVCRRSPTADSPQLALRDLLAAEARFVPHPHFCRRWRISIQNIFISRTRPFNVWIGC